jgi:dCTP deaminase
VILSRDSILNAISEGEIIIEPFDKSLVGIDTVDVRLGRKILLATNVGKVIDPKTPENYWKEIDIGEEEFLLPPGSFILGSTLERIGLSKKYAAMIEGRSSIGRLGIMVHVTAGLIHAGFGFKSPSTITLEIYSINPNPVRLYAGMRIAQLAFFQLDKELSFGYDDLPTSKYKGQDSPLPPKGIE